VEKLNAAHFITEYNFQLLSNTFITYLNKIGLYIAKLNILCFFCVCCYGQIPMPLKKKKKGLPSEILHFKADNKQMRETVLGSK
jgi:hypothetical protein